MSARNQFHRTICNCTECSRYCRTMPGMLGSGDVERIASYLELDAETVELSMLEASPGAVVGRMTPSGMHRFRIPTIVPRLIDGQCVFLEPTGLCRVHAVAPFGCAYCDSHMTKQEGDQRVGAVLREIMQDPVYHDSWRRIADARGVGLTPEEKRKNDFAVQRAGRV